MNLLQAARCMFDAYEQECSFSCGSEALLFSVYPTTQERVAYIIGSNDVKDWESNVNALPWWHDGSFYHKGFLNGALALLSEINRLEVDFIVGHSRGAAIGSIVSRWTSIPCIAFNCPRALWMAFQTMRTPCIAVQAEDDFICKIPSKVLGYQHIGTGLWFPGRATSLQDNHRMKWMIERLTESPFGQLTPFEIKKLSKKLETKHLKAFPDDKVDPYDI